MKFRVWMTTFSEETGAYELEAVDAHDAISQYFKRFSAYPWLQLELGVRPMEPGVFAEPTYYTARGEVMAVRVTKPEP